MWKTQKFRLLTECTLTVCVVKRVQKASSEEVEVIFQSIWEPKPKVYAVKIQ